MLIATNNDEYSVDVGSASFLFCFYSTLVTHIPNFDKKLPNLFRLLQEGHLTADSCSQAAKELNTARDLLSNLPPDNVVWDMAQPEKQPPWGSNIAASITSLGNYFVTANGEDLVFEILTLLQVAEKNNVGVAVK